jgi:hypothetical protein
MLDINVLFTFETAPFFCVCPVFINCSEKKAWRKELLKGK